MKRLRFTEGQVIGVLQKAEAGSKIANIARRHGLSEATLCNWKPNMEVWKYLRRSVFVRWRTRMVALSVWCHTLCQTVRV
jgi:hypothetical protein